MIRHLIFDFGQVLVRFDPAYMTGCIIDNAQDARAVEEVLFDRLYWDRLDRGTISDRELLEDVCRRLPRRLHEPARQVYLHWPELLPPMPGMEELLTRLHRADYDLYLLSNISEGFARGYSRVEALRRLFSAFSGLVFSAPLHMVKPEPAIFGYLCRTYRLAPDECLFVDDNAANIAGSEAVGIRGFLFEGNAVALSDHLRAMGLTF